MTDQTDDIIYSKTMATIGVASFLLAVLALAFGMGQQVEAANPDGEGGAFSGVELVQNDEMVQGDLDSDSFLYVIVPADGDALFSGFVPDHVVRAMRWEEAIAVDDRQDPTRCAIYLEIDVRGLRVDHPDDRRALQLEGGVSEWERRQIGGDMRAEDQLHVEQYPTIEAESLECRKVDGRWESRLEVTVRGQAASFEVPLDLSVDGDEFRVTAEFETEHSDFGMEPYSGFLGTLRTGDPITFGVDATGTLQ